MAVSRRRFLKTGIAGGILLVGAGYASRGVFWGKGSRVAQKTGYRYLFLTERDHATLGAIAPVVIGAPLLLEGGSERDAVEEVLRGIDTAVSGFLPEVQKEVRQLLTLLGMGPTRVLVAGVWQTWPECSRQDIENFLNRWRYSRFDLLKTAYDALLQLSVAAWYGNPKSWEAIGYSGPPRIA